MLGAVDIDSWDEDIRSDALASLVRAGWDHAATGEAPTFYLRRLLARFRTGERLTTRELSELSGSLVGR